MKISNERLIDIANQTGFRSDILEKAIQLLGLLEALRDHPTLESKLALKGGTALNVFYLDIPRLSVDIDLNYVGAVGREESAGSHFPWSCLSLAMRWNSSISCSTTGSSNLGC